MHKGSTSGSGPQRFVNKFGDIWIGTFKDDVEHGLSIQVGSESIIVEVFKEGSAIFHLKFSSSGEERKRSVKEEGAFTDVVPSQFLK